MDELRDSLKTITDLIDKHAQRLVDIQDRLQRIEADLVTKSSLDSHYQMVLEALEKGKAFSDKALTHADQLQEHESKLREHQRRIAALENRGTA